MRRMIAAGPPANRPPHIELASQAARSRWSPWQGSALSRGVTILFLLALTVPAPAADDANTSVALGQFSPAAAPLPAPEVAFTDTKGNPTGFAGFRGKPVIVNLWATWCQPCLREMPSLERLQEKLAGKLTVAAISQDRGGEKTVTPYLARLGLDKVRVYLDPKSEVGRAFGVRGLPTSIVLDAEGREVGRVEGAAEWDSAAMLAVLEPLVTAAAAPAVNVPATSPPR
jgi:thiol-disulfide isomerase/thioredoxin